MCSHRDGDCVKRIASQNLREEIHENLGNTVLKSVKGS